MMTVRLLSCVRSLYYTHHYFVVVCVIQYYVTRCLQCNVTIVATKIMKNLCLVSAVLLVMYATYADGFHLARLCPQIPLALKTFQQHIATTSSIRHHRWQQNQQQQQSNRQQVAALSSGGGLGLDSDNGRNNNSKWKVIVPVVAVLAIAGLLGANHAGRIDFGPILERTVTKIASLGPYGYLYFAAVYILAEVLAIPAMPLTASSGYLFGLFPGFLTVLTSATIGACISFFIGRTLLRGWALKIASGSAKWRAIDKAIGKEGFKVILLLRMSPLLPFAISNYLYGLTSVDFWSYLAATFLGFAPGTLGVVYAGSAGKALFSAGMSSLPWYAYAGGGALVLAVGNIVAKVATDVLKQMEAEEEATGSAPTSPAPAAST